MSYKETICKILIYIEQKKLDKITINELAQNFYLNRFYLMKIFKKELGISIINYLNAIRIKYSLDYFKNHTILSISLISGFYSQEYFSEIFKKVMGVPPIKYKKFINAPYQLKEKDYDTIVMALTNLEELNYKKEKYLSYKKPQESIIKFPSLTLKK